MIPKPETFVKSCLFDIFVDPKFCPERGTFVKNWLLGEGQKLFTTAWMQKKRHQKSQISVLICFQTCSTRYTQNRRHNCSPPLGYAIKQSPSRRQAVAEPSPSSYVSNPPRSQNQHRSMIVGLKAESLYACYYCRTESLKPVCSIL